MSFIDTHVHIDFYDNFNEILKKYEQNMIYTIFVTNLPELYEAHKDIFDFKYNKYVKLALGYHPEMTSSYDFKEDLFIKYVNDPDYIGEIGLNFTSRTTDYQKQLHIFSSICKIINSKPKVLSIHSKGAEKDVLEILSKSEIMFPILHWYSGPIKLIKEFIEIGCYFSINSSMINSVKGSNILKHIPMDRILFETDGPFTKFNKKIIDPSNFNEIYEQFNKFYNINNFQDIVFENFKALIIKKYNYKTSLLKV